MKEKLGSQKSEMSHKRTSADEALRVHEEKWKALQAEKDTLVAAFNEEIESGAHILQSLKTKKEEYKAFTNVGVSHSKVSKPPDLLSAESMERRHMKKQKITDVNKKPQTKNINKGIIKKNKLKCKSQIMKIVIRKSCEIQTVTSDDINRKID